MAVQMALGKVVEERGEEEGLMYCVRIAVGLMRRMVMVLMKGESCAFGLDGWIRLRLDGKRCGVSPVRLGFVDSWGQV